MYKAEDITFAFNVYKGTQFEFFQALPLCKLQWFLCCALQPTVSMLILSWPVVVVVGVASCCCIPLWLALLLVLTFAPCACGGCHLQLLTVVHLVFLLQSLAQILRPLAHVVVSLILLQFALVVFSFHPLAQIPYLHSSNLHCVVVVWQCMYITYKWKTSCIESLIKMNITEWWMPSVNLFSYNYIIAIYVLLIGNSWQIAIKYYIKPPNMYTCSAGYSICACSQACVFILSIQYQRSLAN